MEPLLPPNLQAWTDNDEFSLDKARFDRLHEVMGVALLNCALTLTLDCKLVIVAPAGLSGRVLRDRVKLRYEAWAICGVVELQVHENSELIYAASTYPKFHLCDSDLGATLHHSPTLDRNATPKKADMTNAVLTQSSTATAKTTSPRPSTPTASMPVLRDLASLSNKVHMEASKVADRILQLGGFVAWDEGQKAYRTTDHSWKIFVDDHLAQLRESMIEENEAIEPAAPMIAEPSNGNGQSPEIAAEPAAAPIAAEEPKIPKKRGRKPKQQPESAAESTDAPPQPKSVRLKNFKRSHSYSKTVNNFLAAQGWDDQKQGDVVEALAALPESPDGSDTHADAEKYMTKILTAYNGTRLDRNKIRAGVILAAKTMTGATEAEAA